MRAKLALAPILLVLAGCASVSSIGDSGDQNFAATSPLGASLPPGEARALKAAFLQAVEFGKEGERFDWKGDAASGWVKAREERVGDLKADADDRPAVPAGLLLDDVYETEQGLYALTSNANARLGPGKDYPAREMLVSGTGVIVIGKVVGKPWMLGEVSGKVVGYIHESLMIKAPGTELELAGGPRKRATRCRAFEQRLSYAGRSELFEGVACREGGGWALMAPPQNAPEKLF